MYVSYYNILHSFIVYTYYLYILASGRIDIVTRYWKPHLLTFSEKKWSEVVRAEHRGEPLAARPPQVEPYALYDK